MARRRDPARLRDVLGETGASLGLRDAVAVGGLWRHWAEIVGDAIARNAQPTSLRKGVLRVKANSPAWVTELTYLAPEIARRANEIAGSEIVREVKVWTGPGKVSMPDAPREPAPPARSPQASDDGRETRNRDPQEALESARRAWAQRHSRGSSR